MLCERCKKKKASIHLTEIVDGAVTELHICEECAQNEGQEIQQHFSIANLLSGLVDFPAEEMAHRKEHIKIKCPSCGMSYVDFKKLGRFGCGQCYEAFKRALYPLMKRIHGHTRHVGREPVRAQAKQARPAEAKIKIKQQPPPVNDLEALKKRLAAAVADEAFEEAAVLRDKIRVLEKKAKDDEDR